MSKMYEALKRLNDKPGESMLGRVEIDIPVPIAPHSTDSRPPDTAGLTSIVSEPDISTASESSGALNGDIRRLPIQMKEASVVVPWSGPDGKAGQQYRIIRTRIVQHPRRPRLMVVSSAGAGDGKTVSAINIAGVLSLRDNADVLLIDADFRRAQVSSIFGLPANPGLANTLAGSCTLQDALIQVEQFPSLYVLPAGTSEVNPAELLDTAQWKSLCATVREHFSYIIVDAPPVAAVADYELIQAGCDGVIVVIRPEYTDRTLCSKALELIPEQKRVGVVFNCAYDWFLWKTHESYYYSTR